MDFSCIVLFLACYYLKPQEWTGVFATIRFVQLTMIASVITLVTRERSLTARDFFRTPHDWAMFAFFTWVVLASPNQWDTFKDFLNRLIFYVVIVQTLTNWARLQRFLGWWTAMIVIVAGLAIAGEYFWDPLGSHDLTHGKMQDRLVLNLSMVNNPNSLGHTLVPVIPMLYFFCVWKRPVFMKQIGYVALTLPLFAIYLTASKGAFVAGAVTILATVTFGRPKFVQVIIASVFLIGASSALYLLPRMTELNKAKTDEAIQGRVRSFTNGHTFYTTLTLGIGQGKFVEVQNRTFHFRKAPHSTFVQTGAELGKTGLFLFLLITWCCMRTLMFAKTQNAEQERVRRLLFVLVVSYLISGWMVDFAYRATFFMFAAAIAAFHRNLYGVARAEPDDAAEKSPEPTFPWQARTLPVPAIAGLPETVPMAAVTEPHKTRVPTLTPDSMPWLRHEREIGAELEADASKKAPKFWNRITLLDIVVTLVLLKITEMTWVYIINNMRG